MQWYKLKDKGKGLKDKLKAKGKNIFRPHSPVPLFTELSMRQTFHR